jgi:hypothetical protein
MNKTGAWYHKERPENLLIIQEHDDAPGEGYTQAVPIEDEPYQYYDEQQGKWVVDVETIERLRMEKERWQVTSEIQKLKSQIEDAERRTIRPLRAISRGRASEEDTMIFEKYDDLIEELRPKIAELENELAGF